MSHMVKPEENMMNLNNAETQFTVVDSRTHNSTTRVNWHSYQRRDGKIHSVALSNVAVIPGLYKNIFSVTQALQKGFQVMS